MKYWTDPFNPFIGCSKVSPGCDHCYALTTISRFSPGKYADAVRWQVRPDTKNTCRWTGHVTLDRAALEAPLRMRKPRVFFNSMCDVFHENIPDYWISDMLNIPAQCTQHTFVFCTKRARRAADYLMSHWTAEAWPNIRLGVTVENQDAADERLPWLAKLAAAGWWTWISYEPALGPVNWTIEDDELGTRYNVLSGKYSGNDDQGNPVKLIIAGGESGPNARPAHPQWFRDCRDACKDAGVRFIFKQWGDARCPVDEVCLDDNRTGAPCLGDPVTGIEFLCGRGEVGHTYWPPDWSAK